MIKAVIFDMDGVLIEAKDWHYDALNRALELFGYAINRLEHLTMYDGLPTKKKLEMLSIQNDLPQNLHGFINEMKQIYTTELVHAHCRPRFNHEFALSTLKARGYKVGVASNSIRHTIELMMQKAGLARYLDVVLSNEDVVQAKPHPEIYLKAMQALGCEPHECVIVEDNENGVKAARASGAHVLVVKDVEETNLENILARIRHADEGVAA
ncbi:HAD family hydrolase [Burkholderia sp. WSM2230]|uniref:HAD family hydrolase n=1 Tax=Burkholderia sp. WSM2230 TaxID=944435 RepID=UPI00041F2335|nr:HAD family phosphatase [Burkholderia sp. WSM2230]